MYTFHKKIKITAINIFEGFLGHWIFGQLVYNYFNCVSVRLGYFKCV